MIDGLILHPDNEYIMFPLGTTIIIRNIITRTQQFLRGHDNDVTVIRVSNTGKYVASGQKTHMGFQAEIIIWDFDSLEILHRLKLHKVTIQTLSFSFNEQYLASVGGQDDNTLVIWNVESGKALCGSPVGMNVVNQVAFFNTHDNKLVSIHNYGIRIWTADFESKKLLVEDVNMGSVKRIIKCIVIDPADTFCYVGTQTGDIVEVSLEMALFKRIGPVRRLFSQGINCISQLPNGDLLVGAGDGSIGKIGFQDMKVKSGAQVAGAVTSFSLTADGTHTFIGSDKATIYWSDTDTLNPELRNTCHYERINDIAFPHGYSQVFATCSLNDIRVWNSVSRQELLRIEVPGLECFSIEFMRDGKSIVSGWSDGKIRAFLPQSGKLFYVVNDAHNHGVTAVALTSDCERIVSGGMEGEVRIWKIGSQTQVMEVSLKEHRGRVSDIRINQNDD